MSESETPHYLTRKAFAQSQGWAPSYITKLGHQGRLVMSADGKLIDVPATLERIAQSADRSKAHVAQHFAAERQANKAPATPAELATPGQGSAPPRTPPINTADTAAADDEPSANKHYWLSRARREAAAAEREELKLAQEKGTLVAAADVHAALAESSRMLRDMILAVPSRVGGQVLSADNAGEAERIIRAELRQALEQFARLAKDGLQRRGCQDDGEVAA